MAVFFCSTRRFFSTRLFFVDIAVFCFDMAVFFDLAVFFDMAGVSDMADFFRAADLFDDSRFEARVVRLGRSLLRRCDSLPQHRCSFPAAVLQQHWLWQVVILIVARKGQLLLAKACRRLPQVHTCTTHLLLCLVNTTPKRHILAAIASGFVVHPSD